MMPFAMPWPAIAVAMLCVAAGVAGGYALKGRLAEAQIARIQADHAAQRQAAAEAAAQRLAAAQDAADRAVAQRDARIAELDATTRRLRHDLRSATTGRPCLSADARGLLHQSPAFGTRMPETSGGVATAPAAAAPDPGERADSTDADLARWILDVAALYEQCRARIDAIRQWDEVSRGR
jgi:hypothetical protein